MSSAPTDALSYYLLPGKPGADFSFQNLHNHAYVFWRDFWRGILAGLGSDKPLLTDDFLRQDRIAVLARGEEVVALHLYTMFDLGQLAAREHSYFTRYFPESFFTSLAGRQAQRVMTMEYFSVAPQWRAAKAGVSLGSVLIGLGLKVAAELGAAASIAPARRDNVVLKLALEQGATSIIPNITVHNAPVDLIAFFPEDVRPTSDDHVNSLVERFWQQRIDTTKESEPRNLRVAA